MMRVQIRNLRVQNICCATAMALVVAVAAPGRGLLQEAAGSGGIFSELWDKSDGTRRFSPTQLDPRKWVRRSQRSTEQAATAAAAPRQSSIQTSDNGTAVLSKRPGLYSDPFAIAADGRSTDAPHHRSVSAISRTSPLTAAPSPRQRGRDAQTHDNSVFDGKTVAGPVADFRSQPPAGNKAGHGNSMASDRDALIPHTPDQQTGLAAREFDRLVQSVIRESEILRTPAEESASPSPPPSRGDAARQPVRAPSPADLTASRSVVPAGTTAFDRPIDADQRQITGTDTASPETPILVTGLPQRPAVSLPDAGGHTGRHLQVPPGTMIIPSDAAVEAVTGPGLAPLPSTPADFRNGWSEHETPRSAHDLNSAALPAATNVPRVISNGAPLRSVPNNRQYQKITYKSGMSGFAADDDIQEEDAPALAAMQDWSVSPIDDGPQAGLSSAPVIDWSLDEGLNQTAHGTTVPWGFASVLVTAVSALLAILLLRKRQVVTVVTSGTRDVQETS